MGNMLDNLLTVLILAGLGYAIYIKLQSGGGGGGVNPFKSIKDVFWGDAKL